MWTRRSSRKEAPGKRSSWQDRDRGAELVWKWILRFLGAGAFIYVLTVQHGNVPVGIYVLIGGFVGLPNVFSLQRALNEEKKER